MATPRRLSSRTPGRAPRRDLDQFASLYRDPSTPQSTRRQVPLASGRTPRGPSTPHALRALQDRATARTRTPGKERRKSSRLERETPIAILRHLGRKLAPTTNPILSSSTSSSASSSPATVRSGLGTASPVTNAGTAGNDVTDFNFDMDTEPELERPRLSLSLEEMGITEDRARTQDSISPDIQPPPRLSLAPFDEEYDEQDLDITTRSIELPRERPRMHRLSTFPRISIGADAFEGIDEEREEEEEQELDREAVHDEDEEPTHLDFGREETENLDRFKLDFTFPSPELTTIEAGADQGIHEDDDNFQLQPMLDDFANDGFGSPDSSIGGGSIQLAPESDQEHEEEQSIPNQVPYSDTSSDTLTPVQQQTYNPRISKHGLKVPKLPSGIVKKIASRSTKGNGKLNKETIKALDQATDWFFEQMSSDLSTYAAHANRKTIDESDVITLLRRQRMVGKNTSVFALAQRNLPGELLQDLRLGRSRRR